MKGLGVLLILGVVLVGCTCVNPGHVGIKINYAGTSRGAGDVPTVQGWVFYLPFMATVLEYPTFVQNAVWSRSPHEGEPVNEEITSTTGDQMQS